MRKSYDEDGNPWFVAKDVCDILELTNNRKAVSSLDEEDKGVTNGYTLGGEQEMTTVNEPGLYNLIFKSRVEAAKEFKRWLTKEVLPSIRKTGGYHLNGEHSGQGIPPITHKDNIADRPNLETDLYFTMPLNERLIELEERIALQNKLLSLQSNHQTPN